jgi:hypothetical protein
VVADFASSSQAALENVPQAITANGDGAPFAIRVVKPEARFLEATQRRPTTRCFRSAARGTKYPIARKRAIRRQAPRPRKRFGEAS